MWAAATVFSAIVTLVNAAAWNVRAHVGQSVALNIGPGVVTWKRQRPGYPAEYIEYCEPEDKRAICGQFVTANNKVIFPVTKAHVYRNGLLEIYSYKPSDAGDYSSPDHGMEEVTKPDGSVAGYLAGPLIGLETYRK
ncbi:unnamed protein product [Cylicocyclus nassatus]|uniref:Uncharacterized protein n=1 Tax=Cylicocyclus nassatus TaxID=53992 RepID=A0AA36DLW1_CYLNA|nr:unnamed protein product [Cylicocyclus nassatus]